MKEKLKSGGDAIKTLIKTGGDVADKVIDKGTDVATAMMNHTAGLISKLSDDIGLMADRILETENKIGAMADRIVKTEELMAKLTASLSGKELALSSDTLVEKETLRAVVLSAEGTKAREDAGPELTITGDPSKYLMYVSSSPLFRDGSTVISKVTNDSEYDAAWKRSIIAIKELGNNTQGNEAEATVVSIAVKALGEDDRLSDLSNSVEIRVHA